MEQALPCLFEIYRVSEKKGNPTLARYSACINFRYYETAEF